MITSRELFIDAIVGAGFPTFEFGLHANRIGCAIDTGDEWAWDRTALAAATDEELQALYTKIKDEQTCR